MLGDFAVGLDFIAALFTALYVSKLAIGALWAESDFPPGEAAVEKRSLLGQQVRPRAVAVR